MITRKGKKQRIPCSCAPPVALSLSPSPPLPYIYTSTGVTLCIATLMGSVLLICYLADIGFAWCKEIREIFEDIRY
jgi:hypothetical protein